MKKKNYKIYLRDGDELTNMSTKLETETKEWTNIDYTNASVYKTVKSFNKEGITWVIGEAPPGFDGVGIPEKDFTQLQRLRKLDSVIKKEKGPVQKIITSMHRQLVSEFDEFGKPTKKEYLTVIAQFKGTNWAGEDMAYESIEGVYKLPIVKKTYRGSKKFDPETGEDLGKMTVTSTKPAYYLELPKDKKARKAFIDSIIEKANGTHAENIQYYYKDTFGGSRDNTFSYEEFTNLTIEELRNLSKRGGGAKGIGYYRDANNVLRDREGNAVSAPVGGYKL